MAEKFAIYAGEPMASALAGYETERSSRINQICDDWRALIGAAVPALPDPLWLALIDICNGTMIDDERTMRTIWASVEDAPDVCEKWGVDHAAAVAAVRRLTWPELIAVREVVRRYWLAASAGAESHVDALRTAGAKPV